MGERLSRLGQRGATLTSYAIIMSTMVVGSLGAVKALDEGSTEVLETTGDTIGEARPTRAELAESITEEDPDGSIDPPDPDPTATYDWQSEYIGIIETPQGFCVSAVGNDVKTADCTTAPSSSLEFFENADDDNDNMQLRVDGLCVTYINDDAPVALAACQDGNDSQMWLKTPSGNLANAGEPGQCLDVNNSQSGAAGAQVLTWNCHGNPNQTFGFPGPYVPPVSEVTSVDASSAALAGNFELDADGFVHSPNGNGYNSTPGAGGTATFTFTVADAGQYRISGSVIAPNGGDDSFWVTTSLDGNTQAYLWDTVRSSTPATDFVNNRSNSSADVVLDIPAGATFTIVVSQREDNTRLGNITLIPV